MLTFGQNSCKSVTLPSREHKQMSQNDYTHRFKVRFGTFHCQDCTFKTTLNISAKQHFAEKNGIDTSDIEKLM